ncbi:hypothetical protein [Aquiflexum gelatinilyticum]|uniref:Lipocalin-like domain-containing protein n=1 Tax=Aquiflexum gelatinilyticum TaxID=2961943 RepID=A0A9X2T386_9BACT|nr:hypothetical protein [Aquiflexum gelatinilyticum]MCR9017406.1 hypothetical protein [Aquiflexum gelatinilyticum]
MKNFHSFFIGFILILFSVCQEKEELFTPELIGTWEKTGFDPTNGYEGVLSYNFKTDGTYTWSISYREPGATENLGYQLIWKGNFRSTENQLTLMPQEIFYPAENFRTPPGAKMEDMVKSQEYNPDSPGSVNIYRINISNDATEFLLYAQPVAGNGPPSDDILFVKVK